MGENSFLCGVVEGFYGRPWPAAQRRQLFAWMGHWGMNAYLYAPKDDLKHRALWRARYTAREADELKTVIHHCRANGLKFIYSIAPGLDITYSSKRDAAALRKKAAQLIELACRRFAILFDDITPVPSSADARAFASVAAAQGFLANEFLSFLRSQIPAADLLFCPTAYCRFMSGPPRYSDYLKEIGKLLDPSVQVFWTGPDIVSETITVESVRELQPVLRRKPVIWDNLHANDYDPQRVYLGPYAGRPLELRDEVNGILSNPNCELEANYVPLRTLAMYARTEDGWNPRAAYRSALKNWLARWKTHRRSRISRSELELLGDCFYLPSQLGPRGRAFLDDLRDLGHKSPAIRRAAGRRLDKTCSVIIGLFDKMTALKNRDLLYALYRHVWALREETTLLQKYVHWMKTNPGNTRRFHAP